MRIEGVGVFTKFDGYWESCPEDMAGSTLSIESNDVSPTQAKLSKHICSNWLSYVEASLSYIESSREKYELTAHNFSNPNVFIVSEIEWSIYFDTEIELEAVVGVEFKNNKPFQLIIGD